MSENKGKAKVKSKSKSKSTMKSAGKNKAAVMNSRNPKKPMAISGDTMSNYAMYKKGGNVKKSLPKAQVGLFNNVPGLNPIQDFRYNRLKNKENRLEDKGSAIKATSGPEYQQKMDYFNSADQAHERASDLRQKMMQRKKGGATYKKGGKVKKALPKHQYKGVVGPRTDDSVKYDDLGKISTNSAYKGMIRESRANRDKLNAELMKGSAASKDAASFYRDSMKASSEGANQYKTGTDRGTFIQEYNQKRGGSIKRKYKSGGSFPDLNKDGKITKADILKGRGVIKKKGGITKSRKK
jgi:hypothetical protein